MVPVAAGFGPWAGRVFAAPDISLGVVAGDRRSQQSRRALPIEAGGGIPRRPGWTPAGGEGTRRRFALARPHAASR